MAINFPSTAGQATDGSYTYTVAGITYSWDGSSWRAAGAGASATDRTLFSVTQNAAGTAALSYNSNSGVFSYTPPDLSGYLTSYSPTPPAGSNSNIQFNDNGAFGASANLTWNNVGSVLNVTGSVSATSDISSSANVTGAYLYGYGMILDTDLFSNPPAIRFRDGVSYYVDIKLSSTTGTSYALTLPVNQGSAGTALTNDGSGNLSWSSVATTGLQSRTTAQVTQSIAAGGSANVSLTTPATYALQRIQTSHAAWVTLYASTTARTADASRTENTDPTPGSGVLAEVITSGAATQLITPGVICFNESAGTTTYMKVVNKTGSTANVTVTLYYLQLEA